MQPIDRMTRPLTWLVIALLGAAPALAQTGANGRDRGDPTPAELRRELNNSNIVFKEQTVSLGEVFDTEKRDLSFEFKNTGAEPLEIRHIKPACGCTATEMAQTVYEPGETGTINVTFDPSGKRGRVKRGIKIYTNSKFEPVTDVFMESIVKPVVIKDPPVLSFSTLEKGQAATKELKVYGRFPDFKVTRATTKNPGIFDIEVEHAGETEHNGETVWLSKIKVTVRESAGPDNHRTNLTIRTNEERRPIMTAGVYARVIGDLELKPVRMMLGRLNVGDQFEREVTVRSRSGEPFEIRNVAASTPAIDADYTFEPIDPDARDEWIVRVSGTVAGAAPRFRTELKVATDVPDESLLTIQAYGQLRPR